MTWQMVRRSSPFRLVRKIAVGPVYCIFSAVISGLRPHTLSAKSTEHSSRFCGLALFQKIEKLRASTNSLSKIVNCLVQSGQNHPQCCKAHYRSGLPTGIERGRMTPVTVLHYPGDQKPWYDISLAFLWDTFCMYWDLYLGRARPNWESITDYFVMISDCSCKTTSAI